MENLVRGSCKTLGSHKIALLAPISAAPLRLPSGVWLHRRGAGQPAGPGNRRQNHRFFGTQEFCNCLKKSLLLVLASPLGLFALGGQPEVVAGQAVYEANGTSEVVRVGDKTILQYKKFNLAQNESTKFEQPSSKSTLLCRVKGKDPSVLRGRLEANGKLLFINPNGIIFSETARVNVGTLIASTLDIQNDDFLNDRFRFTLSPDHQNSSIVNKGTVQAAHNVVFMAPNIHNEGVIAAKTGKIVLMGGEVATLDFDGDRMISFAVETPLKQGVIEQAGQLLAQEIYMKLPMAGRVIRSVLNVNGIVEAGRIEIKDGVIRLTAKSATEARALHIEGNAVAVDGELKIASRCEINGESEIRWLRENTVPELQMKTDRLYVAGPVHCQKWTAQASHIVLESSIEVQNSSLIFNAPVILNDANIRLSTGNIGGPIQFLEGIHANGEDIRLTLSAGAGDIDFKGSVGELKELIITSAHNVNADAVKSETIVQQNGTGITTFRGVVSASDCIDLHVHALNIAGSLSVENGPLLMETSGLLKTGESATISAASISQSGKGDVFLNGTLIATQGDISITGHTDLLGAVYLQAEKGTILFHQNIRGLGGLEAHARQFHVKGNVGRIAHLKVDADETIHLQNVGLGREGIEGILQLHSKGRIYFEGSDYVASEHHYSAEQAFEMNSGKQLSFLANSISPIEFKGGPINLAENTTMVVTTTLGTVNLSAVQGRAGSALKVDASQGKLIASRIQGVEHLDLQAETMELCDSIDAGALTLYAKTPIQVSHPITARTGDFWIRGHLNITAPKLLLQAIHGKIMRFDGPITGNTALALRAPHGKVILNGRLNGVKERFKQININAQEIVQNEVVYSTGPVHYQADRILIGGDIYTTTNPITLNGAVQLINRDAIHFKTGFAGNVELGSLNADKPTRTLTIENGNGTTQFSGDIGTLGPLGALIISCQKIVFHGNIGGSAPGILNRLQVTSLGAQCEGNTYYAGEQLWNTNIHMTHEGSIKLKTKGLPLKFGKHASLHLEETTAFAIDTQGGRLDLAPIDIDRLQPITIHTGKGDAYLKEIGKKATELHVEGRAILLEGHLEAEQIFLEAESYIEYHEIQDETIFHTALKSSGKITINSKQGMVGSAKHPLNIETQQECFVGAKTVAYLMGTCADELPHVYPSNPPPRLFFNGFEYNYLFFDDESLSEENLNSLLPALNQGHQTSLMDEAAIEPRRALIYYEPSK